MAQHLQLPDTRVTESAWGFTETTVHDVRRHDGIAGQVAYWCEVTTTTYPHDEGESVTDESSVTVVGSRHGGPGPVVAIIGGHQSIVENPSRFGDTFDRVWAYRFAIGREV